MRKRKLIYEEWLVEQGYDPNRNCHPEVPERGDERRLQFIEDSVKQALSALTSDEREIIERVHYMGQSLHDLSERSGRKIRRLGALYGRAMKRLERELRQFAETNYGIKPTGKSRCPICQSPFRVEIDQIISANNPSQGWRPVLKQLRDEFGIEPLASQTLICHRKFH